MELLAVVAFALLAVGVVGSVLPLVPGALSSLAGVLVYWYATGFVDPGPVVLVALVVVGLVATAVDYFGGAIAAKAGGASALTTAAATVVGIVLLLVTGPVGLLVGVAGTVFALELYANRDARTSGRTALFATVGVLASGAVQVLLTASMLVVMVLVAVL